MSIGLLLWRGLWVDRGYHPAARAAAAPKDGQGVSIPLTFVQMADPQFGQFAQFSGRRPEELARY